jgi:acyl-CoA dehydrogenase
MSADADSIAGAFETLLLGEQAAARRDEAQHGWSPALWQIMAQNGFATIALPEEQGGAGASLGDLGAVVERAGYHAAPVPLARANVAALGAGLLGSSDAAAAKVIAVDLRRQTGPVAALKGAPFLDRSMCGLPWAAHCDELLALRLGEAGTGWIARVPKSACRIEVGSNIAGEPRADWVPLKPVPMQAVPVAAVQQLCDLLIVTRASAIAGSARRVLDLSLAYAIDRHQFGRAIYAFQAVQHELAELATAVQQLQALLHEAYTRTDGSDQGHLWALAAKICAGLAAARAIRTGHQLHGAMGITMEYDLQRYTRRLMAWRDEDGPDTEAARELGTLLRSATPDRVWQVGTACLHDR